MTLSIVDFLNARLKDDEDTARAAGGGRWVHEGRGRVEDDSADDFRDYVVVYDEGAPTEDQAAHIALHDPARVLREAAAKRRIMEWHSPAEAEKSLYGKYACEGCGTYDTFDGGAEYNVDDINECPELRALASVYPDCPEEWKP